MVSLGLAYGEGVKVSPVDPRLEDGMVISS